MSSQIIGKYELFDKIAAGGMAAVHLGRFRGEGGFSRTVALKRLHPQFAADPEFVAMFLDEARLASRIRHPSVVPTLDVVSNGGEVLLAMDYVVGESLAGLLRAGRPKGVPPRIAVAIMISVLHGLHAAHEAKTEQGAPLELVHRDVSPQNILVGSDGVARVLDFGIAKAAERAHTTRDGKIKGKLAYMAPEQLGAHPLDRRSDIYGCAVVLWECLAGEKLFHGETEAGVVTKVLHGEIAPPSSKQPGLPAALDTLVARGLSREVSARFATAREMAIALERCGVATASASEIGEWVETLARDVLAQRARRVAEIEKGTDPGIVPVSDVIKITPLTATSEVSDASLARPIVATEIREPQQTLALFTPPPEAGSGVSGRYVASTTVSPQPLKSSAGKSRIVGLALLFGTLLGIAAVGVYLISVSANRRAAAVATSSAPPPGASVSPSSAPSNTPISAPIASEAPLPPPPVTAIPPASAIASAKTSSPPHVHPAPAIPAAPAAKKVDCSTPYFVDSGGIRRLKMECL